MNQRDAIEDAAKTLARCHELIESRDFELARRKLEELQDGMSATTVASSAYLQFTMAETYRAGETVEAVERGFEHACRAVQLDPIHPAHHSQFMEFAGRMQRRLEVESRISHHDHAPRLYATLLRTGEADAACHVSMARWHHSNERQREALELLDATLLLAPSRADAWALKADVAREVGDEEEASRCGERAEELKSAVAPFGLPLPTAMS